MKHGRISTGAKLFTLTIIRYMEFFKLRVYNLSLSANEIVISTKE